MRSTEKNKRRKRDDPGPYLRNEHHFVLYIALVIMHWAALEAWMSIPERAFLGWIGYITLQAWLVAINSSHTTLTTFTIRRLSSNFKLKNLKHYRPVRV